MSGARADRGRPTRSRRAPTRTAWWVLAFAVALGLLLYLRSPIDLVPDRLGAIGLLDDLLALVFAVWWLRRRYPPPARPEARRGPRQSESGVDPGVRRARWDPYAVLGVDPTSSPEDVTRAYREQMKLYHPDRVAELGEELRALAHAKSLEIQRAYEEIGPRRR